MKNSIVKQSSFVIIKNATGLNEITCVLKEGIPHPIGGKSEIGEDSRATMHREFFEEVSCNTEYAEFLLGKAKYSGFNVAERNDATWIQHFYTLDVRPKHLLMLDMSSGDDTVVMIPEYKIFEAAADDLAFSGYVRVMYPDRLIELNFITIEIKFKDKFIYGMKYGNSDRKKYNETEAEVIERLIDDIDFIDPDVRGFVLQQYVLRNSEQTCENGLKARMIFYKVNLSAFPSNRLLVRNGVFADV